MGTGGSWCRDNGNDWVRAERREAADLLTPAAEPMLAYHPVPKAVGSPNNNSPDLVEALQ